MVLQMDNWENDMQAEAERRWPTTHVATNLLPIAFVSGAQFAKENLRDYCMAEFQDLHDTHGCQYLDLLTRKQAILKEICELAVLDSPIYVLAERGLSNVPIK